MTQPLKVLHIEDVQEDALLVCLEIKRNSYSPDITVVKTLEELERLLATDCVWDVVLSDHDLRDFDSFDALAMLRSYEKDIPFIIVSGAIGEENAIAAMRAGAHDYISKSNLARLTPVIEREIREATLRREREKYELQIEAIFAATQDVILIADNDGRYIHANPAAFELFALPEEVFYQKTAKDLFFSGNEQQFESLWKRFLAVGSQAGEITVTLPDGSLVEFDYKATAHFLPGRHLSVLREITQYKQVESALRNAKQNAEALKADYQKLYQWEKNTRQILQDIGKIDNLPDLMWDLVSQLGQMLDLDRCFLVELVQNKPLPISVEYRRNGTIESFKGELPPWTDCVFFRRCHNKEAVFIEDTQSPKTEVSGEWRVFLKEKNIRGFAAIPILYEGAILQALVLHTVVPRNWNENEIAFIAIAVEQFANAIFQKQTKEKLYQYSVELERSNQELQQFASVASHDLKAPLRKISLFSEMLSKNERDQLSKEGFGYLERIQRSSQRMQVLVDDLLALAKVTRQAKPFTQVHLKKVVNDVLQDLEPLIQEKGAIVNIGDLPALQGDSVQLGQLMQNLIGNALKFHRKGIPPVVEITSSVLENGDLELTVKDNGIGLDMDHAERIFKIFERLHNASEYSGTGIGLAIVKKIVERHFGVIKVKSSLGNGTCFIITFSTKPAFTLMNSSSFTAEQ